MSTTLGSRPHRVGRFRHLSVMCRHMTSYKDVGRLQNRSAGDRTNRWSHWKFRDFTGIVTSSGMSLSAVTLTTVPTRCTRPRMTSTLWL